jgi:hypothetical protein
MAWRNQNAPLSYTNHSLLAAIELLLVLSMAFLWYFMTPLQLLRDRGIPAVSDRNFWQATSHNLHYLIN